MTTTQLRPRGPLSEAVLRRMLGGDQADATSGVEDLPALAARAVDESVDLVRDEDVQFALFVLYASH